MTAVETEARVYVRWPIAGVPSGAPPMQVQFDGGVWHDLEYILAGGSPIGIRILIAGPAYTPPAGDTFQYVTLSLGEHAVTFRFEDNPERIIRSGGIVNIVETPLPEQLTWGVTVQEVVALVPHVDVSEEPERSEDDMFKGSANKVRAGDVARWITDVSAVVDARLQRRVGLSPSVRNLVHHAAHSIVVNGTAEWVVSAAHPSKAGVNDATSYSAELHRRYEEGLAALEAQIDGWLDSGVIVDPTLPPVAGVSGTASGAFPATAFPDTQRW